MSVSPVENQTKKVLAQSGVNLLAVPPQILTPVFMQPGLASLSQLNARLKGKRGGLMKLFFAKGMGKLIDSWVRSADKARAALRRQVHEELVLRRVRGERA